MSLRPRPVTATVTKPRWMEMPDSSAIAHARRHSLGSTGSTASLLSVLDHDSYISAPSDSEVEAPKVQLVRKRSPKKSKAFKDMNRYTYERHTREDRSNSNSCDNQNLTSWEEWLIRKTQEERKKRQQEIQKNKQEKAKKEEKKKEKEMNEVKAQEKRSEWIEKKNYEMMLKKKIEKQKIREEKREKQEKERRIQSKSVETFNVWLRNKREEDREKKRSEKEKKRQEEEEKRRKAEESERKFQEWCKAASKRPKSAPHSFGYMDGKLKEFHDAGAYPKPSFFNPIPWHPIHIPRVKNEKPKRPKSKKYVWNPTKYF